MSQFETVHPQRRIPTSGRTIDGPTLRRLRQTAGVSLTRLANEAGCSVSHLWRIEKDGRDGVSIELLHRFAAALTRLSGAAVTIDDFTTDAQAA